MAVKGTIVKVSGPLIVASGMADVNMYDVVRVSEKHLIGEVIELRGDKASIQVYEETGGIGPGEPVESTGAPLSVELAPGLIESIYDGIQRPLNKIQELAGDRITRGIRVDSIDHERLWDFQPAAQIGDILKPGDILGTVQETEAVLHKIMVPPNVEGQLTWIHSGEANVVQTIAKLVTSKGETVELPMLQKWPVRIGRPYARKMAPTEPMITGQRVIDTLFPVAKGGVAAVPGPFGSGKTVVQHQLAKWADADIIVYVGCGERGNEMTDVLREFPELKDPRTGESLMKRTVLIANTSDMPVAAREASIYTGITIAEYFRDMGYDVAVIADSTSRWAEALREISGRLEEMPAEEGFPAYLPSRLAGFYERAGFVDTLSGTEGSVTVIGAVSPQGGDFSEPVTQNTQRFVRCFWALDRSLAYARHFPSINWNNSYTEYFNDLIPWYSENFGEDFTELRVRIMALLNEESSLMEIVKLIGADILPDDQKLIIETAKVIREGFLQQNAFHATDTYMKPADQMSMLRVILRLYDGAKDLVAQNIPLRQLVDTGVFTALERMKFELGGGKPAAEFMELVDNAVASVRRANA